MKRKKIFPMTHSELEALSTKQLLARLKLLHQCEDSLALSDRAAGDYDSSNSIEFKDSPAWIVEYDCLKGLLAQREHMPKGVELVEMRQERARKGRDSDRKIRMRKQ